MRGSAPAPGFVSHAAMGPTGDVGGVRHRSGRFSEAGRVRAPWLRGPYRRPIPRGERLLLRALLLGAAVVAVRILVGVIW